MNGNDTNIYRLYYLDLLLCLGFVSYIFRFEFGVANITILRGAVFLLVAYLTVSAMRLRLKLVIGHVWLAGLIGFMIIENLAWYYHLTEFIVLQKEILAHCFNLVMMLCIVLLLKNEYRLLCFCKCYALISLVAIVIAYYAGFVGELPGWLISEQVFDGITPFVIIDRGFHRLSGTFMDPNFFGIYLLTVIVFCVWLFVYHNGRKLYIVIAVISFSTIFLTFSRTSIVGLAILAIVCVTMILNGLKRSLVASSLIFMPLLAVALLYICLPTIYERFLDSQSGYERLIFIEKGLDAFAANPILGGGPESIVNDASGKATTHLVYLSLLAKFGLLGSVSYFIFIFFPVFYVAIFKIKFRVEYRVLIYMLYFPFFAIFLFYDFLYFLEFPYFIFAVGYSVIISKNERQSPVSVAPLLPLNKLSILEER